MNPTAVLPIRRALMSVSDKTGIVELASALVERGVEILSTGGTAIDRLVYCGNAALGAQVGAIAEAAGKPFEMVAA